MEITALDIELIDKKVVQLMMLIEKFALITIVMVVSLKSLIMLLLNKSILN
ncbi:MAG: hypothetical protein ACTS7E_01510 [Arsenophonus sp. NC-CH8-MAG3]